MALFVALWAPRENRYALSRFQVCLVVQELAHKKAAELAAEARARKQAQPPSDDRPLEDLLSFIGTEPVRSDDSAHLVNTDDLTQYCL